MDLLTCSLTVFCVRMHKENRTLKKALTDPCVFDGVGNAYSDEILFVARLSPARLTCRLSDEEAERLWIACRDTLQEWIARLRDETGHRFPEKVTAFHPLMSVHGRFGRKCVRCSSTVQRIVYRERETNYCPGCQTDGRVLRDRSLSRLLKDDWPSE